MNDWEIQQKVEMWCHNAWNSMGLSQLKNDIAQIRNDIAAVRQEMANARTASSVAVSQAKKTVADAEKIVNEVADRMDDLEDEQAKFSEVIKEAKENADKALEESEKKNRPITINTSGGWNWNGSDWTTMAYGMDGHTAVYDMQDAVNIMGQFARQGVQMNPHLLQQILAETARAHKALAAEQEKLTKGEDNANN